MSRNEIPIKSRLVLHINTRIKIVFTVNHSRSRAASGSQAVFENLASRINTCAIRGRPIKNSQDTAAIKTYQAICVIMAEMLLRYAAIARRDLPRPPRIVRHVLNIHKIARRSFSAALDRTSNPLIDPEMRFSLTVGRRGDNAQSQRELPSLCNTRMRS